MYRLPEGVDYAYKGGVPGLYDENGKLVRKVEDMTPQELSTYESDYRRRRGQAQIDIDNQVNAILKAEQEARKKAKEKEKDTPTQTPTQTPAPKPAQTQAPAPAPKPTPKDNMAGASKEARMAAFAKANEKLATAAAERARIRGTAQSDNPLLDRMNLRSGMKSGIPTIQDPKVQQLGKGNQRLKNNPYAARYKQPSVEEAYEVVLDYLLSEGHAETLEEANYVMMQLDAEYIQSIVEAEGQMHGPEVPRKYMYNGPIGQKIKPRMDKLKAKIKLLRGV